MKDTTKEKLERYRSGENEALVELIEAYSPIINKYARYFGSNLYEDMQQELRIAVMEAAQKIDGIDSEGECVNYIVCTIKHRFGYLYKNQYKHNEIETLTDEMNDTAYVSQDNPYADVEFYVDLAELCETYNGTQKTIIEGILIKGYSDKELAQQIVYRF